MAIRDWPEGERPREKLLEKGAAALTDAELLAILLRTGTAGRSALDLAREVLKNFHSLRKLIASDRQRFCAEPGLGPTRYAELQASVEIARRQMSETLRAGPSLSSPRATRDFLTARLRDLEHEVFCCLYLDKRHRLIQFEELFRGTIDGASVHPREIVKLALQRNSASALVYTAQAIGGSGWAKAMAFALAVHWRLDAPTEAGSASIPLRPKGVRS